MFYENKEVKNILNNMADDIQWLQTIESMDIMNMLPLIDNTGNISQVGINYRIIKFKDIITLFKKWDHYNQANLLPRELSLFMVNQIQETSRRISCFKWIDWDREAVEFPFPADLSNVITSVQLNLINNVIDVIIEDKKTENTKNVKIAFAYGALNETDIKYINETIKNWK